jgi:hypothetical protein
MDMTIGTVYHNKTVNGPYPYKYKHHPYWHGSSCNGWYGHRNIQAAGERDIDGLRLASAGRDDLRGPPGMARVGAKDESRDLPGMSGQGAIGGWNFIDNNNNNNNNISYDNESEISD